MTNKKKINQIIIEDVLSFSKLSIFITILILITSVLTIYITYKTRYFINEREKIFLENDFLEHEWNNLILEKYVLGNNNRIGSLAKKNFNMNYIDYSKENIIILK
ncbi:ftsL [Wigglesworthia glossinidia endosymbiont of Glossina brevipalpis]|uniref:Cell division protein FtsL n=1 Tax=Wigglesworthia glossinidia brevipalpis TaxID=36870 RepID=Q8D2Y9_WIGBR|nr:ftsL [Wigglesworthia glossinidia endosymbiont of Glossina brevipalpis]